jgi:hypothetical protein
MSADTSLSSGLGRRRWLILGVIGLAQLMVVLDLTVMNIALPSAQRALHFTTADRQWVVTRRGDNGTSRGRPRPSGMIQSFLDGNRLHRNGAAARRFWPPPEIDKEFAC